MAIRNIWTRFLLIALVVLTGSLSERVLKVASYPPWAKWEGGDETLP